MIAWPSVRVPGICLLLFHMPRRQPLGQENEGSFFSKRRSELTALGPGLVYLDVFC